MSIRLKFGHTGVLSLAELPAGTTVHAAPPAVRNIAAALRETLAGPLDFPPLERAVTPGDRVVLVLDQSLPQAETFLAEIWQRLTLAAVDPEDVLILQPAVPGRRPSDPRGKLPADVRDRIVWDVHDPTDESRRAYLATSAAGERIYLAGDVVHADVVVPVGVLGYDPLLGRRGTNSLLYPGLSFVEAFQQTRALGQAELEPEDVRAIRQTIDEIAWLLGVQFSVQAIAAGGSGICKVFAGLEQSVFKRGAELLKQAWSAEAGERVDVVLAAVDSDADGHGWAQIGAALAAARSLVARGGRIVLLTELDARPGPGLEILRAARSAGEALKPLRQAGPADFVAASQIATAAEWAEVHLLSRLDRNLVEDLFLLPISSVDDVPRLLSGDSGILLESAQHTFGRVRSKD